MGGTGYLEDDCSYQVCAKGEAFPVGVGKLLANSFNY
jgi:hypothetical protein